jgi:hypothetical protein
MSAEPTYPRSSIRLRAQSGQQLQATASSIPPPIFTPAPTSSDPTGRWNRLFETLDAPEIKVKHAKEFASNDQSTRGPNWYERHLANVYQLRTIRILETLPDALIAFAKTTFQTLRSTGHPPPTESFLTFLQLSRQKCQRRKTLLTETGLMMFYHIRSDDWCTLGSMKHIQAGNWDLPPLLMWTPEASQREHAVSDGFLKVVAEEDLDEQELWQVIGEAERNTWRLLRKNAVKDTLANWEFRGLSIESDSVMDGVMRLAKEGSFPWTTCSSCGSHSKYRVDANSDASLRWDAMSSSTTWLGMYPFPRLSLQVDYYPLCRVLFCISRSRDCIAFQHWRYCTTWRAKQTHPTTVLDPTSGLHHPRNSHLSHVKHHKVWTQAVTSDNTFMCLNSGNIEYIGIRHRGTQTLYLSPPIKRLSIAGYGWLQTGLYLAIIEDAIARFSSGNQPGDTPDDDNAEPVDFHEGASPTHPDPKVGRGGRSGDKRGGRSSDLKTQDSGGSMSVDMTTLVSSSSFWSST